MKKSPLRLEGALFLLNAPLTQPHSGVIAFSAGVG